MVELYANIGDPDQMPCSVASDLGMLSLPVTLLGVSRLQWIKGTVYTWYIFCLHSQGRQLLWFPVCFPAH